MGNKVKREVIEWTLIITVFGTLYITGWHTEVIGQVQRLVVATGLMQPNVFDESEQKLADYNFTLTDFDGKKISFEELKGKTIFLNFWATWCPPCIAEMPDIHDLYLKMKANNDVAFVLVSVDDDFEKAKAYIDRKEYEFPIYSMASRRPPVFQNNVVPTTYIISKEGYVVVQKSGMAKYDTKEIRSLLTQ